MSRNCALLQSMEESVDALLAFGVVGAHYKRMQQAEQCGDYRQALYHVSLAESALQRLIGKPPKANQPVASPEWTQLLLDEQRLTEAVYGVDGSDGRISLWKQRVFRSQDVHPPPMLFYGWARYKNIIYRHGGLDFVKHEQMPQTELLWAFDLDTKTWKSVKTTGNSPGPRGNHAVVISEGCMYTIGGRTKMMFNNMQLYKLDLETKVWSIVKAKGAKPPSTQEFAMCVYKGKMYLHGGKAVVLETSEFLNYLWCFDFRTSKWKQLQSTGSTARKAHAMFAHSDKLYIFGGVTYESVENKNPRDITSFRGFQCFDLQEKKWESLRCVGDDPFDLSEYTMLPLYHGGQNDEPASILVWGGYRELASKSKHMVSAAVYQEIYGDDYEDLLRPYQRRLFRFNLDTMVWTRLKAPRNDLMPTAQSWAAEISTGDNNITRIVIGGGYGITQNAKKAFEADSPLLQAVLADPDINISKNEIQNSVRPETTLGVFEVEIHNGKGTCFAEQSATGHGWAWNLIDVKATEIPRYSFSLFLGSSSLHWVQDASEDDFHESPTGPVQDDNEELNLGRRIILQGLRGRSDLNGLVGRCGPWLESAGRYQVVVSPFSSSAATRHVLAVKSTNLRFADPLTNEDLKGVFAKLGGKMRSLDVLGLWAQAGRVDLKTPARSPLDEPEDTGALTAASDTYKGPISGRALALLEYCGERSTKASNSLSLTRFGVARAAKLKDKGVLEVQARYLKRFVSEMRVSDQTRVDAWEKVLVDQREESAPTWCKWLKLKVTLDDLSPPVERELLVSPHLTIAELHHQVLCPAIGWTPNFHAYAVRRTIARGEIVKEHETESTQSTGTKSILKSLEEECWTGPNRSTALDAFFQPLYIGGAMANDNSILLGDLYYGREDNSRPCSLQYVQDFGCWWSHTIQVEPSTEVPTTTGTVAILLSGSGACPPDDSNGVLGYCGKVADLVRRSSDSVANDPSKASWWKTVNEEWRAKQNKFDQFNPFEFDLERHRQAMKDSLSRPLAKRGTEYLRTTNTSRDNYKLTGTAIGPGGSHQALEKPITDPTKACAICGVTAGLMLCSGCQSIAFCGRDHQLEYWPRHKAACKAAKGKVKSSAPAAKTTRGKKGKKKK